MADKLARPIRMGLVGGGPGSFIGAVHRMAAELDGQIEMAAGAFSRDPEKSRQAGQGYGISSDRAYASYEEMIDKEKGRKDAIDFVCITTPNHLHLPVAALALENGFHVVSDKPVTATLEEAYELEDVLRRTSLLFALTYTYTGYPMVREARRLVRDGSLGKIRKIVVEYSQGWLSEAVEKTGHKQATWRADPKQSGTGGAIADIGVHAFNLLEYVSGLRVAELCASLSASRSDRLLDDDCNVLAKLDNGAPAVIFVSQIAAGERNNLRLHVYGEKGGLHWAQENPNLLHINWLDRPSQTLHAAAGYLSQDALSACRLPVGHPEGLIEAFANIYRDFASAFIARQKDSNAALSDLVPGIDDGVRGMMFIDRAVKSSREHSGWVKL